MTVGASERIESESAMVELSALNRGYVAAAERSDAAWYDAHLAPELRESDARWFDANLDADFLNTNPDGSLSERDAFLANIARPSAVPHLEASDVVVRILDDVALIHARTHFTKPDGTAGIGRYTDGWMKRPHTQSQRDGAWRCVSAHVTRG
jgi:hypothetical protein